MTSGKLLSVLVFTGGVLLSSILYAQEIEIKGLRLGMTKDEVEEKIGRLPVRGFTIAGARNKHSTFSPDFHDGKLDSFAFFFDSGAFDEVVSAVKGKYPNLTCESSTVANAMGASFRQTVCRLKAGLGSLRLSRFVSDIRTSVLTLRSERNLKEHMEKQNERKQDL